MRYWRIFLGILVGLVMLISLWVAAIVAQQPFRGDPHCFDSSVALAGTESLGEPVINQDTEIREHYDIRVVHEITSSDVNPAIGYSPDGQFLAVSDGTAIVLYSEDGDEYHRLQLKPEIAFTQIRFNPSYPQMAIENHPRGMFIVDLGNFTIIKTIALDSSLSSMVFTRNGDRLVVSTYRDAGIQVWDALTYRQPPLVDYQYRADSLSVSSASSCIAVAERLGGTSSAGAQDVVLVNIDTGQSQVFSRDDFNGPIREVIFDPSGEMLASFDRGLAFWNAPEATLIRTVRDFYDGDWGPNPNEFIGVKLDSNDEDRQRIVIFDVDSGDQLGDVAANIERINDIQVNPARNKFFATSSYGGRVVVWEIISSR